jgi:hypothetical protein
MHIVNELISPDSGANSPGRGEREIRVSKGSSPLSPISPVSEVDVEAGLPAEVEQRLAHLLAIGAIDDEDAALVRERWHAYPDEWNLLLDACEAAHR